MDIKNLINKCKLDNEWSLGNSVLYDLCKTYPTHKDKKSIVAKIWLIGRAYAAAIERRKKDDEGIINERMLILALLC